MLRAASLCTPRAAFVLGARSVNAHVISVDPRFLTFSVTLPGTLAVEERAYFFFFFNFSLVLVLHGAVQPRFLSRNDRSLAVTHESNMVSCASVF